MASGTALGRRRASGAPIVWDSHRGDASTPITPNHPLIADGCPIAPSCTGKCGFIIGGLSPICRR
eukprot:6476570-Pyramimonas_sp.AAC.1